MFVRVVEQERNFYFAGVARSKSVREPDDGVGPKTDEFFTLSIGGMVTVLNTSGTPIHPGDLVEWCLASSKVRQPFTSKWTKLAHSDTASLPPTLLDSPHAQ